MPWLLPCSLLASKVCLALSGWLKGCQRDLRSTAGGITGDLRQYGVDQRSAHRLADAKAWADQHPRSVAREEKARGPEPDATSACTHACLSCPCARVITAPGGTPAGRFLTVTGRPGCCIFPPTGGLQSVTLVATVRSLGLGARARGRRTGQHDSTELDRTRVAFFFFQRLLPAT